MCGIFGFVLGDNAQMDRQGMLETIAESYRLAESRGKEAAGLAVVFPDRISVAKGPVRGRRLLRDSAAKAILSRTAGLLEQQSALTFLGHTRMVTNGSPGNPHNNQPVVRDGAICLHNGIVVNDAEVWENHPDLRRLYEVDTEIILALIAKFRAAGASMVEAVGLALHEARGANTIAMLTDHDECLLLATTNGSLFVAVGQNVVAFASERYILERIRETPGLSGQLGDAAIEQIVAGKGIVVPLAEAVVKPFRLGVGGDGKTTGPADVPGASVRPVVVHAASTPAPSLVNVAKASTQALSKVMQIDADRIAGLRRCSKCLLPETFPFITYDADGVCHLCRSSRTLVLHSGDELETVLEQHRGRTGRPDCIVPISGGRDSCYSLHYIKKVLGMNPVAYTYDWGMVNDLARRNISRMCGELGIEHILVAADIGRKRENIRLNVEAWLKRPRLGTIPLFMAGDKQFFYYSSKLSRQMDIPLAIYSMNRLERTDFKVGFCGINESSEHSKTYGLNQWNTARMLAYYAGQVMTNPRYINPSILDSLFGFASYYFLPQDYISLFDYIPWNETTINSTIMDQYGWETSPDAASTWRVGDGTAAFYNYIYYRVTGFSEHDTFRSNQIRNGLISREDAASAIAVENRPRVKSFKWYCDTIGLDAIAAVETINRMPAFYR